MREKPWVQTPDRPIHGLATNPAAPVEVLLKLVAAHGWRAADGLRRRRELPQPVLEAMPRHPAPRVRAAVAGSAAADPQVRARLVQDPDGWVRHQVFHDRTLALPEHALRWLLEWWDRPACREMLEPGEPNPAVGG